MNTLVRCKDIENLMDAPLSDFLVHYYFNIDEGKPAVVEGDWYTPINALEIHVLGCSKVKSNV